MTRGTVQYCTQVIRAFACFSTRLRFVLSALILMDLKLSPGIRSHMRALEATYPKCDDINTALFTSNLGEASNGCANNASIYTWGGVSDPSDEQKTQICKCTVNAFNVPKCSWTKRRKDGNSSIVSTEVHFKWVYNCTSSSGKLTPNLTEVEVNKPVTPVPTVTPALTVTTTAPEAAPPANIGLIAGIAGGVVVAVMIVGLIVWKRNRKRREEQQTNQHNDLNAMQSPEGYGPIGVTPHITKVDKYTDSRPSDLSDTTRPTISTANGSVGARGSGSRGSRGTNGNVRWTETGKWDDPMIMAVRIPHDAIFFGALISRGGYGEVFQGIYRGETVAIKQLLPARRKDLKQIDDFLGEVKLVSSLEHERIVKFIGVAWISLSDACMVVEYMENGDLRSVLNRWDEGVEERLNGFDADKIRVALHVAHALTYLHSMQPVVVHRDLKSKNILLDANFDAKLTDFGTSRERADATMTAGVGSSLWMAPEVMMGERYNEKADIFSFGVVLSELDTHQLPYFHARETESGQQIPETAILQQVTLGRVSVGFTDRADPELVKLGRECVNLDPKARPTAAQVLHRVHQVLQGWHKAMEL